MAYRKWGYEFRPQQLENGLWAVLGHCRGKKAYPLTKLGYSQTQDEAQRKLQSWAGHVLAEPVLIAPAVKADAKPVELELFPQRAGFCLTAKNTKSTKKRG